MNVQMKIILVIGLSVALFLCAMILALFTKKLPKIGKIAYLMAVVASAVALLTIKYCL